MNFGVNDSPLGGKEGKYLTSTMIGDRLRKEAVSNVAIQVLSAPPEPGMPDATEVRGRGELQLAVLIENMRREGFELSISPPRVLFRTGSDGEREEPYEVLTIDVDEEYAGALIEKMSRRYGDLLEFTQTSGRAKLRFQAPSRALIGLQSDFKSETRGTGVMHRVFDCYGPVVSGLNKPSRGALISSCDGQATAYALAGLEPRGVLFWGHGTPVYTGMVIGEHTRDNDLEVNPVRGKKLTNVRASGTDDAIRLAPPRTMGLEDAIAYVGVDELVEVTPTTVRLRKRFLDPSKRKQMARRKE
jgi:GTP-binding protein